MSEPLFSLAGGGSLVCSRLSIEGSLVQYVAGKGSVVVNQRDVVLALTVPCLKDCVSYPQLWLPYIRINWEALQYF